MSPSQTPFSAAQIQSTLSQLNQSPCTVAPKQSVWMLEQGKLTRKFVFADFVEAFGFMSQIALIAERMNHHPEWSNVYANVEVQLTTHDAQGITVLDVELAGLMNRVATTLLT